jgi:DNA repair protein RadC
MRYQRAEHPLKLDGLASAQAFFTACFAEAGHSGESLWVAHVDDQARCVLVSRHDGDESGADFPLKRIVADAARLGSAGLVLAHNHPSGDPRPSDCDQRATRRLASAVEALDCTILDHLIFARGQCASFRRMGLL